MKLPSNLPRTVAERYKSPEFQAYLCSFPEVQRLVMLTFASAYSLHLLDCEDPTKIDAAQVWQTFIEALEKGHAQLDDELFERMNYSPVGNSEPVD
jgi:hypothetical protein